jgi:16S rRNA (cytidine1402-2'-O)-methyltransferase
MMKARDQATTPPRAARYVIDGRPFDPPALTGGVYIVATPIGNLRDITLRALDVLAATDLIACEDTRITRRLLDHYGITTPLTPYHEHNAAAARPKLLMRLAAGASLALVSDAGTPLISDPGFKLVRAARDAGHRVTALPGPSAAIAALSTCGLPTDHFVFEGFLPAKPLQRRTRIAGLKRLPATLVLYEGGSRVAACLADLAAELGPRTAALCRELTKLHEEVRRGDLNELAAHYAGDAETRGEFVIVVAPPERLAESVDIDTLLRDALGRLSVKEAVAEIAAVSGQPRREVYQRAIALTKDTAKDSAKETAKETAKHERPNDA